MQTTIAIAMALIAQARTETGKTTQTSWVPLTIAAILLAFVVVAVSVYPARRRHGEPPIGSVPASEARPDR